MGADNLTLRLLGGSEIARDGVPLARGLRAKARALICYLAVSERAYSREVLATLLWSELAEDKARNNLRVILSSLRQALHGFVCSEGGSIGLHRAGVAVDIHEFQHHVASIAAEDGMVHAQAAVELYRGDFLEGLRVHDAPEFEAWVRAHRERLRQLATQALLAISVDAQQRRDYPKAIEYATRLLALEPLREQAWRELISALAGSGHITAALAQFERCRRLLSAELSVEPEQETTDLVNRIRSGAFGLSQLVEPARTAEMRQVTVLACSLVDFQRLSETLEPEDIGTLLNICHEACREAVARYGGQLRRGLHGDWLAYFGYPVSHEDNALRAIRAGVEMAGGTRARRIGSRIGIATGTMMIEPATDERTEPELVGAVSMRAIARCQPAACAPWAVTIDANTLRLADGLFECRAVDGSGDGYRVIRERRASGRFEARLATQNRLVPLVGREAELRQLAARWAAAEQQQGQVVLLGGEAGSGKSRLGWHTRQWAETSRACVLVCHGWPQSANSPLQPLIELFSVHPRLRANRPLLPDLLAAPSETGSESTPRERRDRAMAQVLGALADLAQRQPVLLIVEDLHWVDPSTLELLGALTERLRPWPMLLLLTYRSEFEPAWSTDQHVTWMNLDPLPSDQIAAIVSHVADGRKLSPASAQRIVGSSDGVPLFAEELTRSVLDQEPADPATERARVIMPMTLRDALVARLDGVPTAKRVAQHAAAVGGEFSVDLLAGLLLAPEATVRTDLERLVAAGVLVRSEPAGAAMYSFKHALLQEAAYLSLASRSRRVIHAQIAQALVSRAHELVSARPEVIAEHMTRAELLPDAIEYWQRAGNAALQRAANREAASHFEQALSVLPKLPETFARDRQELNLRVTQLGPLATVRGYTASEVGQTLNRARMLCRRLGDPVELFPVMKGMMTLYGHRGELSRAAEIGGELLRQAIQLGDPDALPEIYAPLGWVTFHMGQLIDALGHLDEAIRFYDPDRHRDRVKVSGLDAGVYSTATSALVLWLLGRPDEAMVRSRAGLELARGTKSPVDRALALYLAALLEFLHGDNSARELVLEALAICEEHEIPHFGTMSAMLNGAVDAMQSPPGSSAATDGVARMQEANARFRELGVALESFDAVLLGGGLLRVGRAADGLHVVEEALAALARTEDRWCEAEVHRVHAELLAATGATRAEVDAAGLRAVHVARRQQARAWEVRARTSMASLRLARTCG